MFALVSPTSYDRQTVWLGMVSNMHIDTGIDGYDKNETAGHLHIGHFSCTTPLNTLSISFLSSIHLRLTSGMPIAHKPQPKKGTHFSSFFANHLHLDSMPERRASSWIM